MRRARLTLSGLWLKYRYYVRRRATLPSWFPNPLPGTVVPAVVLHRGGDHTLSLDSVRDSFDRFLQTDDVFQKSFTKHSFLLVVPSPLIARPKDSEEQYRLRSYASCTTVESLDKRVPSDLAEYLESRSLTLCFLDELAVPEGPYFVADRQLHQAWRLYPDHLGAFSNTVIPDDTERFQSLQNSAFTGSEAAVAVPSRLYYKPTPWKPLSGRRIAIKDNMDLGGVVTGLGNRAYAELYGERSESAKLIQLLLEKGAVVVGKTKLSAFAGSEVPPTQCVDYFPPWNARGDGYQGPSGSSSGAASATGGYSWLDHSIGTDTTGSIRFPATSHGVWGLRSTWNSLPIEGVVPSCSAFDTFGLLGRTASSIGDLLAASGHRLAKNNATNSPWSKWPTRLLYPTEWLPVANDAQQRMIDAFLAALESYLGLKHQMVSLQEEWAQTGPKTLRHKTLLDIFKSAKLLNFYDNKHNFDKFRAEYQKKFEKSAYISPSHLKRWEEKVNKTQEERDRSLQEIEQFREWAQKTLFSTRGDGSSNTIMLVPHGRPGANYRDTEPSPASGPSTAPPALSAVFTVSAMGTPQLLIPSKCPKTGTLDSAGWPSTVLTGRYMFQVGNNERHSTASHLDPKL
ncbi:amidase [Schizothecium vesticola]|uniref:Amidase n=1 Tax=Schizothecium vesticola TaxID=314040 RepID=A0AA40F2Y3_9PEZI|nr:amidase [Schizothecium vesticola]